MKRTFLSLLLLFVSSAAFAEWEAIAPGADYQHIRHDAIDAHVVRIDLTRAELRVIASRESDRALKVSDFAKKNNAIIAVNGDYFDEKTIFPIGKSLGACGVWWEGSEVKRKQGFVAVGEGRAEIQQRTMDTAEWMTAAVSGWPMLVKGCEVIQDLPGSDFFTRAPHPRTSAGLSKDGKTLFLVVTDGRKDKEGVPGLTLPELAAFLHDELGICEAMNLDGGGSSAIWVRDRIVNTPSDGFEREVGNHLGVVLASDYEGCPETERRAKD